MDSKTLLVKATEIDDAVKDLPGKVAALEKGKADKTALEQAAGDLNTLSGTVAGLGNDISGLGGAVSSLSGAVSSLSGDVSTLGGDVSSLSGDVSALSGNVSALGTDVGALGGRVIPAGGSADQVLAKKSGTDFDVKWAPPGSGGGGESGADGDNGWTPLLAVVSDVDRRVHQVVDWTGGGGSKPAAGQYVGASGLVPGIAQAVDIRGGKGKDGTDGDNGDNGDDGDNGWTPKFAVVSDGDRRVLQVIDWFGGGGSKPVTGVYVGASGYVDNIAQAIDIRGEKGEAGDGSGGGGDDGDGLSIWETSYYGTSNENGEDHLTIFLPMSAGEPQVVWIKPREIPEITCLPYVWGSNYLHIVHINQNPMIIAENVSVSSRQGYNRLNIDYGAAGYYLDFEDEGYCVTALMKGAE